VKPTLQMNFQLFGMANDVVGVVYKRNIDNLGHF
jgi:hypothetical protein